MQKLQLETERLIIRNLESSDVENFHLYRSNPEVTKYQSFDVMTLDQAEKFIANQKDRMFGKPGEWAQYAIEHKDTKKLIGDCAINLMNTIFALQKSESPFLTPSRKKVLQKKR